MTQLKENIKNKRQEVWSSHNYHLKKYKPKAKPLQILDSNRNNDVLLRRVKLGHTSATHDFILKNNSEEAPSCECLVYNLTARHWIYECSHNQNILTGKSPQPEDFQIPDHKEALLEAAQNLK